ncbi:glucosamine kinase [Ruegeria halocynthiae]|uniref:Glucosamine kinase n=1 Tax=Ruegeria halocynthiae TaxID=985054 RepID=A0A1H2UC57_9RHOB|nr:BadF/BadG/BcrA/BcrD ATPase family protein [Ruegeria halocynthiae]SDW53783.1 glucosamine kinase [Ruegeria halocynthiae]
MSRPLDPIVLAVDGGGTRCRIAVSDDSLVQQVEVGSANVSTDFEAACVELKRGIASLAERLGLDASRIARVPAYLGLAGITGKTLAERLAGVLPFDHVRIEDDRPAALRGALGPKDGFVAHCGTGSFLAAQRGGQSVFAGGWGPVLGDQASAQWVGRRALSRTLDCIDDLQPVSEMAEVLLSRFGGAAGVVRAASGMSPTDFGALAPVVTLHAGRGDELAVSIMQAGAQYLAGRMEAMGWAPGLSICLTGGIGPHYAAYLPKIMQQGLANPLGDPLTGAIALARAFQEEIEHERC